MSDTLPLINGHNQLYWKFQIASENGHRNSEFSHNKWQFSLAMVNYQSVTILLGGLEHEIGYSIYWEFHHLN